DVLRVVGWAETAQQGEGLGGERLVEFDEVDVVDVQVGAGEQLAGCRVRADAHDPGRDTGRGDRGDAGQRGQRVALDRPGGGDQERHGAVVDTRGVAGGDA